MGWVIAGVVVALLAASPWFMADSRDSEGWGPVAGGRLAHHSAVRPFSASPGAHAVVRVMARIRGFWGGQHQS